jgi:hypothetical protein
MRRGVRRRRGKRRSRRRRSEGGGGGVGTSISSNTGGVSVTISGTC